MEEENKKVEMAKIVDNGKDMKEKQNGYVNVRSKAGTFFDRG